MESMLLGFLLNHLPIQVVIGLLILISPTIIIYFFCKNKFITKIDISDTMQKEQEKINKDMDACTQQLQNQFGELNEILSKYVLKEEFNSLDEKVDKLENKLTDLEINVVNKLSETENRLSNSINNMAINLVNLFKK